MEHSSHVDSRPIAAVENMHRHTHVLLMDRIQQTVSILLSILGLTLGAVCGLEIAGIFASLMFALVGAIVGLCLGLIGWRMIYLLALFP
jgi:hypothetical protein